jgi:hypothetical protein
MTAQVKYDFIKIDVLFQFLYNHDALTSLPISRTDPIITIGQNCEEKIAVKPIIE